MSSVTGSEDPETEEACEREDYPDTRTLPEIIHAVLNERSESRKKKAAQIAVAICLGSLVLAATYGVGDLVYKAGQNDVRTSAKYLFSQELSNLEPNTLYCVQRKYNGSFMYMKTESSCSAKTVWWNTDNSPTIITYGGLSPALRSALR